ncbi:MAG: pentapeptide repeat-containing protein [Bifidobacterium sp.]|uniref:Pentapeptide repeat-containing protein n=1 Tax=Bifidobacterium aquikefiricola TaxID=3059038 RepID=A0AB39U8E8_9BIFI
MMFMKWVSRWWIVGAVVAVEAVAFWVLWNSGHLSRHIGVVVQISVTAFTTVFVGVLGRNNSKEQGKQARERAEEIDLRSRSSELMGHQADAIDHLESQNAVVCAAGISELVWLIRGWTTLTKDSLKITGHEDAPKRWSEHVQGLADLAFDRNVAIQFLEVEINESDEKRRHFNDVRSKDFRRVVSELKRATAFKPPDITFREVSLDGLCLGGLNCSTKEHDGPFCTAHFEGAHFGGAHLEGAHFGGAHLEGAHFGGAHLEGAHLEGAHLEGAHFTDANYMTADSISVQSENAHLEGAHLEGASYNTETEFPFDFKPKDKSMIDVSQNERDTTVH